MAAHIDDTPEARMLIQKAKNMMSQISIEALKINKDHSSSNKVVVVNVISTIMGNCKKHKIFIPITIMDSHVYKLRKPKKFL